ncbi:MAG: PepSY-associated TM helix domain-containing protein [Pseudomonadota bacterium]
MTSQGFQGAFRQSMAWLHTWSGLVLSLLLYFIFITGSFGYFNLEVDHWMEPERPVPSDDRSSAELATVAMAYLQREYPDAARYFVGLPTERQTLLRVFANLKEPGPDGKAFADAYLDPATGNPVTVRDTGGGDALYEMHYSLHYMPYEVAIYVVGVGTLFMLLALVTGIVTHKKIFVDFFTLRFGKGQRSWLDAHNVSSVLALPFMLMITYSGLVFYTFEYSPGVLFLNMGIDEQAQDELYAHIYPGFEDIDAVGESAELLPVANIIERAQQQWPNQPLRYVDLTHPGDKAAHYGVGAITTDLSRGGTPLRFDAVTGAAIPVAATPVDAIFSDGILAMHEGRFADIRLRWLYFLSGLLGAAMVATGLVLWAKKRRTQLKKNAPVPRSLVFIERTNLGIIVGLPLGVAAYFWANRLLPLGLENRAEWEMHCLFLVWAASFAHSGARELSRAWREQVALLAALFALVPLLNALTTDTGMLNAVLAGDWVRLVFDLTCLVFGICSALVWRRLPVPVSAPVAGEAPVDQAILARAAGSAGG